MVATHVNEKHHLTQHKSYNMNFTPEKHSLCQKRIFPSVLKYFYIYLVTNFDEIIKFPVQNLKTRSTVKNVSQKNILLLQDPQHSEYNGDINQSTVKFLFYF